MTDVQSQVTSNPSSIAQWAAVEALTGPQDEVAKMAGEFDRRRRLIVAGLNALPGVSLRDAQGRVLRVRQRLGALRADVAPARGRRRAQQLARRHRVPARGSAGRRRAGRRLRLRRPRPPVLRDQRRADQRGAARMARGARHARSERRRRRPPSTPRRPRGSRSSSAPTTPARARSSRAWPARWPRAAHASASSTPISASPTSARRPRWGSAGSAARSTRLGDAELIGLEFLGVTSPATLPARDGRRDRPARAARARRRLRPTCSWTPRAWSRAASAWRSSG